MEQSSKRSRKLALNIDIDEKKLQRMSSVIPCLFKHPKHLETFHLYFREAMGEPAAIFFNSIVKEISMRTDTLQNLRFNLSNRQYFNDSVFANLDFVFSGADFATKNKIKTLDIHFDRYYYFKKWNEFQYHSEEDEEEDLTIRDRPSTIKTNLLLRNRPSYEPFTTQIIPQLTNLKELKVRIDSDRTVTDVFVSDFLGEIAEKLTKLEDLSFHLKLNDKMTQETFKNMRSALSDKSKSLFNLKKININFADQERYYYDDEEPSDPRKPIKELLDAVREGRPEATCVVTFDDDDSFSMEPEDEVCSGSDDSDENLSGFLEENQEAQDEDYMNFLESLKHDDLYEFY